MSEIQKVDPRELRKNSWNTNKMTAENEEKLRTSVRRNGLLGVVLVRELKDGSMEIVGGEHRVDIAIEDGQSTVNVQNLGKISDARAKEMMLLDNGRYGQDDPFELAGILDELAAGGDVDLSTFMPFASEDMDKLLSTTDIDLDSLDYLDEPDYTGVEVTTEKRESKVQSHQVLRFKVTMDDAAAVKRVIDKIMESRGFTEEDSLTNAGDALVYLAGEYANE